MLGRSLFLRGSFFLNREFHRAAYGIQRLVHLGQNIFRGGLGFRCFVGFFRDRFGYRFFLQNGRNDGGVIDLIALHIAHKGLTHLQRILPAVGGIGSAGLENDLRHFVIGKGRGRQDIGRCALLEGQETAVVDLIQDHTRGVDIYGVIQGGIGIRDLRRGVSA